MPVRMRPLAILIKVSSSIGILPHRERNDRYQDDQGDDAYFRGAKGKRQGGQNTGQREKEKTCQRVPNDNPHDDQYQGKLRKGLGRFWVHLFFHCYLHGLKGSGLSDPGGLGFARLRPRGGTRRLL